MTESVQVIFHSSPVIFHDYDICESSHVYHGAMLPCYEGAVLHSAMVTCLATMVSCYIVLGAMLPWCLGDTL